MSTMVNGDKYNSCEHYNRALNSNTTTACISEQNGLLFYKVKTVVRLNFFPFLIVSCLK